MLKQNNMFLVSVKEILLSKSSLACVEATSNRTHTRRASQLHLNCTFTIVTGTGAEAGLLGGFHGDVLHGAI
jgi:hypothetical protein